MAEGSKYNYVKFEVCYCYFEYFITNIKFIENKNDETHGVDDVIIKIPVKHVGIINVSGCDIWEIRQSTYEEFMDESMSYFKHNLDEGDKLINVSIDTELHYHCDNVIIKKTIIKGIFENEPDPNKCIFTYFDIIIE